MYKILITAVLLLIGAVSVFYGNSELINNAKEKSLRQREIVHLQATRTFKTRIERFASVVSGFRSHIVNSDQFPDADNLQKFLNYQVKDLNFQDSIIISFIDPDHNFIYSMSNNAIDPSSSASI